MTLYWYNGAYGSFYIGSIKDDSQKNKGWFIGPFVEPGLRNTDALEIKAWHFATGPSSHAAKSQREALEINIVTRGRLRGTVDGETIEISAGQFIVIPPGIKSDLPQEALEDSEGFCIKTPSIPEDKQELTA